MVAMLSAMNAFGVIVSFVYPFMFVNELDSPAQITRDLRDYLLSHCVWSGILFTLICLFFFDKKKSKRAKDNKIKRIDVRQYNKEISGDSSPYTKTGKLKFKLQLKGLFSDWCFICMFMSVGMTSGVMGGIGGTINETVSIWGYPEVKSTFFIIIFSYLEE